ncbi:NAD(P)-dependent oxidoreductase [Gluconobacter sphaericus NBRC 12467]|uniref:dTDP-4-dehydrorhamnose reductase n=3 Tax=Gluconobacter sphaericus TaxID=574987 RepID=A0AA37SMP3_9PROT|nr:dTDP-4-dehydrorhamnose reductase [Gluconobacter sphaericus]GBR50271.1 dTDP-4-dehydrorhamnose reductase [Gluconobacter sphaericus NBRC 12467]GEB43006.1 NAD(P)-dependent oxidoreductase [Gluconobacter sphaericus NBRC 12467]GLQ85949.1 NAD(P)-dependent oxidoreductase [Gluconobacter sphaericus NBRC 12467]
MTMSSTGPILVTGGNGQLATSLQNLGDERIIRVGRPEFDFDHPETIAATVEKYKPSIVVNAAAWTAVDLAETEKNGADRANNTGPTALAAACAKADIPFIHVSTDYVFSGNKGTPYTEEDATSPETVYGNTKAEGEQAVLTSNIKSIILRTSWVYSAHGKNFVRTMINAGAKNPVLKVVGDQKGNPTSSDDLAEAILAIIALIERDGWKPEYRGIFHASGTGETTWHGLAVAALEEAAKHGQTMPQVNAIRTEDWPTPAKRPQDSRMDNSKLHRVFGVKMPDWRHSVTHIVHKLFSPEA